MFALADASVTAPGAQRTAPKARANHLRMWLFPVIIASPFSQGYAATSRPPVLRYRLGPEQATFWPPKVFRRISAVTLLFAPVYLDRAAIRGRRRPGGGSAGKLIFGVMLQRNAEPAAIPLLPAPRD